LLTIAEKKEAIRPLTAAAGVQSTLPPLTHLAGTLVFIMSINMMTFIDSEKLSGVVPDYSIFSGQLL